jgi:N-acetylglucosaminyldiphosphoundecaprenol N-acetyl-beta-D-mannosaminyltransferase
VPRYNVLGVGVSALAFGQARDLVVGARGSKRLGYVCLCTAHGLDEARADPAFRRILNESWLTTPDGMPLVWLGPRAWSGCTAPTSCGPCATREGPAASAIISSGGRRASPGSCANASRAPIPGSRVVGTHTPPFRELTDSELQELSRDIAQAQPDIVWVGLGTPKQERFMAGPGRALDTGLLVGVGAAFDFLSGRVRQAPRWMQRDRARVALQAVHGADAAWARGT